MNRFVTKFKKTEIGSIPKEWSLFSLGELLLKSNTGLDAIKRAPITSYNTGIKCLRIQDISQKKDYINWGFCRVSEKNYDNFNLKKDDILIARTGETVGVNIFINDNIKAVYNNGLIRLKVNNIKIIPRYLYDCLQSKLFENFIDSIAFGTSTQPNIQINALLSFKIALPSIDEQKKFAEILSSLDDKIELNRKINENLEKLASSLFKQWFVDFDFPNKDGKPYRSTGGRMIDSELGEIPGGWRVSTLGEFFPIVTGKKDANVSTLNGQYPFFSCSQEILHTDEYSFNSSSLLLAGNGDFNVKWYEGKFDAYQRTYVLTPKNKVFLGFLYFAIKHFLNDITAGHRGSVIRFITKGMIENYKIAVPSDPNLKWMATTFYETIQLIDFYKKEIENLSQTRDSLLPRLMNGKIRV